MARDCRVECVDAPLDRRAQTQIGAFAGAAAVLGALGSAGKPPLLRAAIAGGAAAVGAAASTALATYVARRRCEIICAALNDILNGQNPVVDAALLTALQWAVDIVQAFPRPMRPDEQWLASAVASLAAYVHQQHGGGDGANVPSPAGRAG